MVLKSFKITHYNWKSVLVMVSKSEFDPAVVLNVESKDSCSEQNLTIFGLQGFFSSRSKSWKESVRTDAMVGILSGRFSHDN